MVFSETLFSQVLVWVLCGIYFGAIFPQIFLNYKLKSTAGLSNLMLLFFFVGYISEAYYVICLHLPIGYRFFVPLGLVAVMVMQNYFQKNFLNAKGHQTG